MFFAPKQKQKIFHKKDNDDDDDNNNNNNNNNKNFLKTMAFSSSNKTYRGKWIYNWLKYSARVLYLHRPSASAIMSQAS